MSSSGRCGVCGEGGVSYESILGRERASGGESPKSLMNVYCMYKICENRPDKSKHKPAIIYMAVVIGAFIMFYPCLSGMPMPEFYDYNILRWLASWYV